MFHPVNYDMYGDEAVTSRQMGLRTKDLNGLHTDTAYRDTHCSVLTGKIT